MKIVGARWVSNVQDVKGDVERGPYRQKGMNTGLRRRAFTDAPQRSDRLFQREGWLPSG